MNLKLLVIISISSLCLWIQTVKKESGIKSTKMIKIKKNSTEEEENLEEGGEIEDIEVIEAKEAKEEIGEISEVKRIKMKVNIKKSKKINDLIIHY